MNLKSIKMDRRKVLGVTALGLIGFTLPKPIMASASKRQLQPATPGIDIPMHWPNIEPELVSEVVGKSHSDLERVRELVDARPELARCVWEWRFGDFESAIGAASHVGRRDIVTYLMDKGARPTIFTFAMLGAREVVQQMIEFSPGIQSTMGPHGISLLDHAYYGERMKESMTPKELDGVKRTIDYLESLGDAGAKKYVEESNEEQAKFLGDYRYGTGEDEGFTISLNMSDKMALGPLGGFGGALNKIGENDYTYNGAPSVRVRFDIEGGVVKSLTLTDPTVTILAEKVL